MRVSDVMSSPVVTVRPHAPVGEAAASLVAHGFTALPVVDAEGRLCGLVTEADLVGGRIAAETDPSTVTRSDLGAATVAAAMTPRPVFIDADVDLADLADLMLRTRSRAVPVVREGRLIGIVTTRDVLRVVAARVLAMPAGERR